MEPVITMGVPGKAQEWLRADCRMPVPPALVS
jgi:hypothetical protein